MVIQQKADSATTGFHPPSPQNLSQAMSVQSGSTQLCEVTLLQQRHSCFTRGCN